MPVYWSPSSRTALAEAELEYNDQHKSSSLYTALALTSLPDQLKNYASEVVNIIVWTTTPWTLPANKAVCFSADLQYSLVKSDRGIYMVCDQLVQSVFGKLNTSYETLATFPGEVLTGSSYNHPIYEDVVCPLLPASHVTADIGTGFVHTAPAHGHEDFMVALKHALSMECMVDEQGCYTSDAGEALAYKHVFDEGNRLVMEMLGQRLLYDEVYTHKYPNDWRTKQPVIIRASNQWFIDTAKLKHSALRALEDVDVFPAVYKTSLRETIWQRPYWCISRQRVWGVPIPAFQDQHGKTHINRCITDYIRELISTHGTDVWWQADDDTILPAKIRAQAGLARDLKLTRAHHILDIWFDSGVTWSSVLKATQADMYIEGVDQIRGWFQSSLLTSVALNDQAPYKSIMLHGFTVDENGQKMSKSLGNVFSPADVIFGDKNANKGYGVDVLRWWAASKYCMTNVDIGPSMIRQCNDKMLQMRKRMRFILGNLYDFSPDRDLMDYGNLLPQDQYFLHLLFEYASKVTNCYDNNEMSSVLKWLELFMARFSNIYATMSKDRLYCFPKHSKERRSAQTVLHHTFEILVHSIAPILPFFAEDCFLYRHGTQLNKGLNSNISVFKDGWLVMAEEWNEIELAERFDVIYRIVDDIRGLLGSSSLDMYDVLILAPSENSTYSMLKELQHDDVGEFYSHSPLCETIQCAHVALGLQDTSTEETVSQYDHCVHNTDLNVTIYVKGVKHKRCERCRRYTATKASEPCDICLLNMAHTWAS